MSSLRRACAATALLSGLLVAAPASAQPNPVTITGDPVAPSLALPGSGLCVASSVSTSPANDFPTSAAIYNAGINAFLESRLANRTTYVQRTLFDLSNNNATGLMLSYGDFTDAMLPGCRTGGCDLFTNDTTTSFASRFRGFLNVTSQLAGRPLHFGFYADDAVSLVIYDKGQNAYPVVTRPPILGAPTWRTTNTVTFAQPGLYPVEILYVEIVEHGALELAILDGPFTDFELPANQMGSQSLKVSGFTLMPSTSFFTTEDGVTPFLDPGQCAQCNRQFANQPGNGGCGSGYFCNGAAVCAPCNSSLFCGPTCSPCGLSTPFCVNLNGQNACGECRMDSDCQGNRRCDPDKHTCEECNLTEDCERGKICDGHKCVPCSTRDACAGVSCNCCPGGASIKCAALVDGEPPICVECTANADCNSGKRCDTVNGRCVDQVAECNTPDRCGPRCVRCPAERPFCLDGEVCVECRSDVECGPGSFCISGECAPCATDRHCGARCASCGGETPFCDTDGTTKHSRCVRCRKDADCVGGRCDPMSQLCTSTCAMSCAPGTLCDGARCVACYADTQCPCGGTCDLTAGVCTGSCNDSVDCLGTDHCSRSERVCMPGRRKPGTEPQGGGYCDCLSSAVGGRPPVDPAPAWLLLVGWLVLRARSRPGLQQGGSAREPSTLPPAGQASRGLTPSTGEAGGASPPPRDEPRGRR